ncbi:MAG: porin family protein [Roseivirga sp.]|nr:porin family protein [Roseivirga sp.]
MRKSILLSVMLLVCTFAFAQTQKGQVQLGGVFNFSKQEISQNENNNFNFIPQAGYFVSDLTSLGVLLNISNNNFKSPTADLDRNLFEFGVFARFHKSVADKLYMYIQPSLSFGSGENDNIVGGPSDLSTTAIRVSPGLLYFATPKIALEMRVGSVFYEQVKETTGGNEVSIDNYGLTFNLANVNFGASFFL